MGWLDLFLKVIWFYAALVYNRSMSFSIALVFHFNQHTSEFAAVANRACYRGLLTVLRAHPALKCNLHFSGTLLRALNWFDPGTLELVRAGLADGQFELLGSTYAQNVPFACDDWDNAQQISLHQTVLDDLFGVRPAVFWNAERCWRQSLVPLIAQAGYRVTLMEDHILRAAGVTAPLPVTVRQAGHALTAVWDDPVLRERFNYAAWFGRRAQFFNYLDTVQAQPGSEHYLVAYAEDAEAMGLWPWQAGYLPQATWAHLDKLLGALENRAGITAVHLSAAQPHGRVEHVPDGAARWMDRALLQPDAPYHEPGFVDWFDYLHRSPKVQYFRKLYTVVRTNLQQVGAAHQDPGFPRPPASAAEVFYRQAIETYCSHQYEFGCIGVGGRGYWGWENVRAAFLYSRLAELAADPRPRQWIEDLNGDGSDEQVLCDGQQVVVLTAYGGRLLGWYDLRAGRQWVGNPLAVPAAPYTSGASEQPQPKLVPARWLPETADADLRPWRDHKVRQAAPNRLSRHYSPELFAREPDELVVYTVPPAPAGQHTPRPAQTGALNDWLAVDGEALRVPDSFLDYRFEPDGVVSYLNALLPDLRLDKRVRLTTAGLEVAYTFQNLADQPRRLTWRLAGELAPDYHTVLSGGRPALEARAALDAPPAVYNTRTGAGLILTPSRPWTAAGCDEHVLGLNLWLTFELELAPLAAETVTVTVTVQTPPEAQP